MRFYKEAIYIGCGDYTISAGPIEVLSFTKDSNTIKIRSEIKVDAARSINCARCSKRWSFFMSEGIIPTSKNAINCVMSDLTLNWSKIAI